MAEPFVFIMTVPIRDDKAEGWVEHFGGFAAFIEASEPRLLHFATYVSEDRTEASILQVHPDVDSMRTHLKLLADQASDHGSDTAQFLDFDRMRYQVYGVAQEDVLEQLQPPPGSAITLAVSTPGAGFSRLPAL